METDNSTNSEPKTARRRSIMSSLKGLGFTMVVLAALWIALRYVLTPLVVPSEAAPQAAQEEAAAPAIYEERIKALEDKVAALESAQDTSADTTALEERIAALEAKPEVAPQPGVSNETVDLLKAEVDKLKADNHKALRSIMLVGQLQDRIRNGSPFVSELNALRSLHPELKETTEALEPLAAAGVATLEQLQQQFANAISPALAPQDSGKSFAGNLRSLVKVRKVGGEQQGGDDQAIIARAEARLKSGFIAMAINEIGNLSPAASANFDAWVKRANDHLLADAAGQRLEADIAKGTE